MKSFGDVIYAKRSEPIGVILNRGLISPLLLGILRGMSISYIQPLYTPPESTLIRVDKSPTYLKIYRPFNAYQFSTLLGEPLLKAFFNLYPHCICLVIHPLFTTSLAHRCFGIWLFML